MFYRVPIERSSAASLTVAGWWRNQLSNATRSGNMTVAGATHTNASSVTVAANGGGAVPAIRYADATFARTNVTLVNGTNTFVAAGTDSTGRGDTNTSVSYLPSAIDFLYDLNGNLRTNGTRVLEYDDENQLTKVTEPGAWKAEFVYDGKLRMRVSKDYEWRNGAWVLTNEVRRVYDGMLVLQERDQFNVPKLTYTRGKDLSGSLEGAGGIGGLLALTSNSELLSPNLYYHSDGNGNVTALVDTNQNVVARYLFDPFGNTLSATGSKAALNKYRFSSKELHGASSLVYYGYRWYIPESQRWGSVDPIGDVGFSSRGRSNVQFPTWRGKPYAFVENRPIGVTDPLGLSAASDCYDKCEQESLDAQANCNQIAKQCANAAGLAGAGVGAGLGGLGGARVGVPATTAAGAAAGAAVLGTMNYGFWGATSWVLCMDAVGIRESGCNWTCLIKYGL